MFTLRLPCICRSDLHRRASWGTAAVGGMPAGDGSRRRTGICFTPHDQGTWGMGSVTSVALDKTMGGCW